MVEQSPFPGEAAVVKKVLVVCPVTLITVCHDFSFVGRDIDVELEKRVS
jgi:hypothetical protein